MRTGSGPAGEVTMDDVRKRLASVAARFTAMRATASGAVAEVTAEREPGQSDATGGDDAER